MNRMLLTSLVVAGASSAASAAVDHFAAADSLNGGLILVETQIFDPATGQCFPGQTETGVLDGFRTPGGVPGVAAGGSSWSFEIIGGHTFVADWRLRNTSANPFVYIKSITFDLSTSTIPTFFDNSDMLGGPFGTVGSFEGIPAVVYDAIASTAPLHTFASEFNPWGDACNAGDMFTGTRIEWADCAFGSGQLYQYRDDTDEVPTPGTAALLALSGLMGLRRRR